MTDTATRTPTTLLDEPLPEQLQPAPPAAPVVEQTYVMVPIGAIKPNPGNPRQDLGDLTGLVASIRAVGVQQALAVELQSDFVHSYDDSTATFMLLAGHRRLAAAQLAGLTEVPCLVRQTASTDADRMKIALVENLMREGLAPLDEARGYAELVKLGMSQREIATQVGCSQGHVSKRVALLDLPDKVQAQVGKTLTLEAAAALSRLAAHPEKLAAAAKARPDRVVEEVESAEKDIAWEAKVAELAAIAEGRGWATVDEPRDHWAPRAFKLLAKWQYKDAELDLDVHKHEAEPCHAVMIPRHRNYHNEKPAATSVCTEPGRHHPKGSSDLKVKPAPKAAADPAERQREKDRKRRDAEIEQAKASGAARRAVLAKAVHEHKAPKTTSPALAMSLRLLIEQAAEFGLQEDACALLGVDTAEDEDGNEWPLTKYAGSGVTELHRAALAVALVDVESLLSWSRPRWAGDRVEAHFAWLAELGYQLSPYETAKLAEAEKSGDV